MKLLYKATQAPLDILNACLLETLPPKVCLNPGVCLVDAIVTCHRSIMKIVQDLLLKSLHLTRYIQLPLAHQTPMLDGILFGDCHGPAS